MYNQLRNKDNKEGKEIELKSTFLQRQLEQLKSNPNPKKWWDSTKELAEFHRNFQISTFLFHNQILTGKPLANKINDAFSSVTQNFVSLQPSPVLNQPELSTKYLITEDEDH